MSPSSEILLHSCCAPCALLPIDHFHKQKNNIALYWDNPFIHPLNEYLKRYGEVERLAGEKSLSLYVNQQYDLQGFIEAAQKHPKPPERCYFCYQTRLHRTFQKALELSIPAVSTTLLISPYQDHDYIRETGKSMARDFDIHFYYLDQRNNYRDALNKAKEIQYYTQSYCGCILSEYERYEKKLVRLQDKT